MSNYQQCKDNIRVLIKDYYRNNPLPNLIQLPISWRDQNRPRPSLPYIGLKVLTTPTHGHSNVSQPDNSGISNIAIIKTLIVSVQFYSNTPTIDPVEQLENLVFYLKSPESDIDLQTLNIAYYDNTEVSDITGLIDQNNIEGRAQTDITFGGSYRKSSNLGVIEDVNFSGTYNNPT